MNPPSDSNKLADLLRKLAVLERKQSMFGKEISDLRSEILSLKSQVDQKNVKTPITEELQDLRQEIFEESASDYVPFEQREPVVKPNVEALSSKEQEVFEEELTTIKKSRKGIDFEKFIGENLINKIGIIILILGVAIGAKYSIEKGWINPLTRIILGYITGLTVLGVGLKLKSKYENYSAVLVSGAMVIMYFITFAAYDFYGLISQLLAFIIMAVFTAFMVATSLNYNRQIIALIGLVGAYAVPFLLSDNSGEVGTMFAYMTIINTGILFITFQKNWKPVYYTAFGLSWLIFLAWFFTRFSRINPEHFQIGIVYAFVFFVLFYLIILGYKLIKKEKLSPIDTLLILVNAMIFYGVGYRLMELKFGDDYLGLFTLLNAIIHFIFAAVIFKQKLGTQNLFYLVSGLVLVFLTLAIPVELDGNWVTIIWVAEAVLLFWIGRTKQVPVYEYISYVLVFLAFGSLLLDWEEMLRYYNSSIQTRELFLLNKTFLTAVIFVLGMGYVSYLLQNKKYAAPLNKELMQVINYGIPLIVLFVVFNAFRVEISNYWHQLYIDSKISFIPEGSEHKTRKTNFNIYNFSNVWSINYVLFFMTILSFINIKKIKSRILGLFNIGFNVFFLLVFLSAGLFVLSEMREAYLEQELAEYYKRGIFNLGIRYVSYVFAAVLLYATYLYTKVSFIKLNLKKYFELLLAGSVLWILSSEFLHWMDIAETSKNYKLGLSIFWGVYCLGLISFGIWKKKKHLRIFGIAFFALVLVKLFVYDLTHLDTLSKTVILVSLGVLLLIISFLYNKYQDSISDEDFIE